MGKARQWQGLLQAGLQTFIQFQPSQIAQRLHGFFRFLEQRLVADRSPPAPGNLLQIIQQYPVGAFPLECTNLRQGTTVHLLPAWR